MSANRVKWLSLFAALSILLSAIAVLMLAIPLGLPAQLVRWYTIGIVGLHIVIDILYFVFWKPTKQKPRPSVKSPATTKKGVTS